MGIFNDNLVKDVFPILDERYFFSRWGLVINEGEFRLNLPNVQLTQSLANYNLA